MTPDARDQPHPPSLSKASLCPFHDGIATLDGFLAELNPRDYTLFDAALDLRLLAAGTDAQACVAQLFRVRALLEGRHYLAFYRVRCWARRTFHIRVRVSRTQDWVRFALPLDGGRLDEVVNTFLSTLAIDGEIPAAAYVSFAFSDGR